MAAAAALQHRAQPPVLNLRDINPYVASAVGDYAKPAVNLSAAIPRGIVCPPETMCHAEPVKNQHEGLTYAYYRSWLMHYICLVSVVLHEVHHLTA